jgi:hypothetical protein
LFSRIFNHVAGGSPRGFRDSAAGLTLSGRNRLLFCALAGSDVNQGDFPMAFLGPLVSSLSVVTAYLAIAFVGAIVLGVF